MADTTEYAATFNLVDTDGDGRISAPELVALMQALGDEVSDEQAAEVVARLDSSGDGLISLEEFATYLSTEKAGGAG
ncbi:EF-hand domain-containing protein [Nocardiopsis sediminis]|uniref:EF-hand domain-containing protein n=1 Tax=Nocardiopsis sediminis TaxID=1778267 RepID=A0ABV8FHS9_9ACTN